MRSSLAFFFMQCTMFLCALLQPLVVVLVDGRNVSTCFIFPNSLYDLGFTYQANRARVASYRRVSAQFVNDTIFSHVMYECLSKGNFSAALSAMINANGCEMVMAFSNICFQQIGNADWLTLLATYSHVQFLHYNNADYFANVSLQPANFRGIGVATHVPWYAAGAAAAVECQRCIGMVYPLTFSIVAVNAFYRGMKFGHSHFRNNNITNSTNTTPMCPLYAISMGAFLDAEAETALAHLFTSKGCDIVAYWADSQSISQYIAQLQRKTSISSNSSTASNTTLFSIANNANAGLLWGDSVLTSVVTDFTDVIYDLTVDIIQGNPIHSVYVTAENGSSIATLSPRVKRQTDLAAQAAFNEQVLNYSMWCGGFTNNLGAVVYTGCKPDSYFASFRHAEMGIIQYPRFVEASKRCLPGTFALYNVDVNFTLQCLPCPVGMYSSTNGSTTCVSCPDYMEATERRDGCVVRPSAHSLSMLQLCLAIVLPVIAFGIVVFLGARYAFLSRRYAKRWEHLSAPTGASLSAVAIAVNNFRSLDQWRQDIGFACRVFDELESAVWEGCFEHGGYVNFASGDVYLVICPSVRSGFELCRRVERCFVNGDAGQCVSLRFMITTGEISSRIVKDELDGRTKRTRYGGRALDDLLRAFANWKPDAPASIVILPPPVGSFFTSMSTASSGGGSDTFQTGVSRTLGLETSYPLAGSPTSVAATANSSGGGGSSGSGEGGGGASLLLSGLKVSADAWVVRPGASVITVVTVLTPEGIAGLNRRVSRVVDVMPQSTTGTAAASGGPIRSTTTGHATNFGASTTSVVPVTEEVDVVFDCVLMSESEMHTLLSFGLTFSRLVISLLETPQRKQLVRDAATKMHVRLDVNTARRRDPVTNKVFFGEEQVMRAVVSQILRTMDEQELVRWVKETGGLRWKQSDRVRII